MFAVPTNFLTINDKKQVLQTLAEYYLYTLRKICNTREPRVTLSGMHSILP